MIKVNKVIEEPKETPQITEAYRTGVFNIASFISDGVYDGGNWGIKKLSNKGFYMFLKSDDKFVVHNKTTGASAEVSSDLFSVIVNIYVSSHLSFWLVDHGYAELAGKVADNYHLLRDFLYQDETPFSSEEVSDAYAILD